jgi:DNA-binding Lrp family transcriptional regulator
MLVWKVSEDKIDEVGNKIAQFKEVTHCIQRPVIPGKWPYNLYSMVHQSTRQAVQELAKRISEAVDIKEYTIVYSTKGSHPQF